MDFLCLAKDVHGCEIRQERTQQLPESNGRAKAACGDFRSRCLRAVRQFRFQLARAFINGVHLALSARMPCQRRACALVDADQTI